jgi:hypothetical protein
MCFHMGPDTTLRHSKLYHLLAINLEHIGKGRSAS